MTTEVFDNIARKLESRGWWRRAATRWLEVMHFYALSDVQRDWVRRRRQDCLSNIPKIVALEKLDIAEIGRAAKATQERMRQSLHHGAPLNRGQPHPASDVK